MIPAPRGADAQWESIWAPLSFERPGGNHMNPAIFLLMSLRCCAACLDTASAAGWIGPDEKLSGKYNARDLDRLLEENKLAGGENIKVVTLSRGSPPPPPLVPGGGSRAPHPPPPITPGGRPGRRLGSCTAPRPARRTAFWSRTNPDDRRLYSARCISAR